MFVLGLLTGILISSVIYLFLLRGVAKELGCLTAWCVFVLRSLNGLLEDLGHTLRELNEAVKSMEVDETDG